MKIITPTDIEHWCDRTEDENKPVHTIFFAGTIDNGNSYDWQYYLNADIADIENKKYNFTIYNPRRRNWNKTPYLDDLRYQIKWEENYLDEADTILMYFAPKSISPISLLELGLYATSKKIIVFLSREYSRYENVVQTCRKYDIPIEFINCISLGGDHNKQVIDRLFDFIDKRMNNIEK